MPARTPYAPHRAFAAPAKGDGGWIGFAAALLLVEAVFRATPALTDALLGEDRAARLMDSSTVLGLSLQLAEFGVPVLALFWFVRQIHGRSALTLFGPPRRFPRLFWRSALGVGAVVLVIAAIPPWFRISDLALPPTVGPWLITLPIAAVAVLIQAGSEEIVFRGYIQQWLAARFASPLVWLAGPSLLFGLIHIGNASDPFDSAVWVIWATLLGAACADLTARTGSLGPAIGLHWANNMHALILFGEYRAPDSAYALFLFPAYDGPETASGPLILPIFDTIEAALFVLVIWVAARVAIRR